MERLSIATLRRGSVVEMVDDAIQQVLENVADPNTEAVSKRKVTMTLTFAPDKEREQMGVAIAVKTAMAPQAVVTTTAFLAHTRDGIVGAEYDPRQPGLFEHKDEANVEDFATAADAAEGGE
jgi:hypothetical protein